MKKTNKAIASKIMSLQPQDAIIGLLRALGYVEIDQDQDAWTGDNYVGLSHAYKLIERAQEDAKFPFMSKEEVDKILLMRKNADAFAAKQAA